MKATITLELEVDLQKVKENRYDPSPRGVALPRGSMSDLEVNEEELGERIYEDLCTLLYEHEKYPDHVECEDGEAFADDLTRRYNMKVKLCS